MQIQKIQSNSAFGMPWVYPLKKITQNKAALVDVMQHAIPCELEGNFRTVHRAILPKKYATKSISYPTGAKIVNTHQNTPNFALFYEEGSKLDKFCAVPMTRDGEIAASLTEGYENGFRALPVQKNGHSVRDKIVEFMNLVNKDERRLDYLKNRSEYAGSFINVE